jgi:hypothetical protein
MRWRVEGKFCSVPCVKGYIDSRYTVNEEYSEIVANLRGLIAEVHERGFDTIGYVWAAPDPCQALDTLGLGSTTRAEYREKIAALAARTLA